MDKRKKFARPTTVARKCDHAGCGRNIDVRGWTRHQEKHTREDAAAQSSNLHVMPTNLDRRDALSNYKQGFAEGFKTGVVEAKKGLAA